MAVKRKRIGVLVGNANQVHMVNILNGIYHAAEDMGVDVVVLAGYQIEYCFQDGATIDKDGKYVVDMLREHVRRCELDGVLICFGSHTLYMDIEVRNYLLEQYSDIPYVLLEEFSDKINTGYIINDNYSGMRKMMEHLVLFHGYTRFLYLDGYRDNRDSIERKRAFVDVLRENDIEINDNMCAYGSFVEECESVVEDLLDRNDEPEAIVCANDLMAYAAYKVCRKRGIKIGNPRTNKRAVAITGYDDIERSAAMDPPLTTILQDFYSAGYSALGQILALLRDGITDSKVVPTILQKRCSCGCDNASSNRFMPLSSTERTSPEFYAIKVAEIMKGQILISDVNNEVGDRVYDLLYDALYSDIMISNGLITGTLNADVVIEQIRELLNSNYSQYISPYALVNTFSDYLSTLIHSCKDYNTMTMLSDIMIEGMKYLQAHLFNRSNELYKQEQAAAWQLPLITRDMLLNNPNKKEMNRMILDRIDFSDKSDIYLFLFDKPVKHEANLNWHYPDDIRLVAYKNIEEGLVAYDEGEGPIVDKDSDIITFAAKCENLRYNRYCIADVYYDDYQFGFMVSRMNQEDTMYLAQSAIQVATALYVTK